MTGSLRSFLRKSPARQPSLKNSSFVCQSLFQVKVVFHEKVASLALHSIAQMLFLKQLLPLAVQQDANSPFVTQSSTKLYSQGLRVSKINNFRSVIKNIPTFHFLFSVSIYLFISSSWPPSETAWQRECNDC